MPQTPAYPHCNQPDELEMDFEQISRNERRTLWVVALTTVMMVIEVGAGYLTGSMALLADGYHMFSHAGALGISFLVYRLARSERLKSRLTFGTGKILPLGGYTSAIGLGFVALWMGYESVLRFFSPVAIEFNEALIVAAIGLVVNLVSVAILGLDSHSHEHEHEHNHDHGHDHNHRSAVLHVLADAVTSIAAIAALLAGKYYGLHWLDPVIGIAGAAVILKWAYSLCKVTAKELLDFHPENLSYEAVKTSLARENITLRDLHASRTGPGNLTCQMIVETDQLHNHDFYRRHLGEAAKGLHLVVEQRLR